MLRRHVAGRRDWEEHEQAYLDDTDADVDRMLDAARTAGTLDEDARR